jgi:hypothetical protein
VWRPMTGHRTPTPDRPRPDPSAPTGPHNPSTATPTTATVTVTIIVTVDDAGHDAIRLDVPPGVGPVGPLSPPPRAVVDVDGLSALAPSQTRSPATGLPVYSAGLASPSPSRSTRRGLAIAVVGLAVLTALVWLSQPDRKPPAAAPSVTTSVTKPDGASPSTEGHTPTTSTPSSAYPDCNDEATPCAQPWPDALTPDADVGVSP